MNFHKLTQFTLFIAFITIILGAYTRLSNAGLGCPDWPGCYGQLLVPETQDEQWHANQSYPEYPLESEKAWKEMWHRYVAGTLGLLILLLCHHAWKNRQTLHQPVVIPTLLVIIVMFQALLGMWTVTLLLKPLVVVSHLLFGFITLAMLFWLTLHSGQKNGQYFQNIEKIKSSLYKFPARLAIILLLMQIVLGGWTSSNYAALACPELPTCHGLWWPEMNFQQGFNFFSGLEDVVKGVDNDRVNYEGGILNSDARTAIHVIHRIGAVIVFIYLMTFAFFLINNKKSSLLQKSGVLIASLVCLQFLLGLANVFFNLPLVVATAHNAVAALLLLSLVFLNYILYANKVSYD